MQGGDPDKKVQALTESGCLLAKILHNYLKIFPHIWLIHVCMKAT